MFDYAIIDDKNLNNRYIDMEKNELNGESSLIDEIFNGNISQVAKNDGVKISVDTLKEGMKLLDESNPNFIKELADSLEQSSSTDSK